MIVERDVGRLAKYTFDMGGAGDLLSLALSVPPWEELHELTPDELRITRVANTDKLADVLPQAAIAIPMAQIAPKTVQDRFVSSDENDTTAKSTKTAEAVVRTGGSAAAPSK